MLDLQLSMQSVPITTDIVSSNPAHGEVYSELWNVSLWFSPASLVSFTDRHYITDILLKVALNTITITPFKEAWE
jgi:hypothetical protein